ncbi:hypothetical protein ACQ5SO_09945 [Rhodovulum sp. DZ06]|uniref:hypothetical protein n=1 Tax=Rhodovulum sp. DZ06 TaxID=3425126 RepID=UPI003D33D746
MRWYGAGGAGFGVVREVYAAISGVHGPGGFSEARESAYLVDGAGGEVLKRQSELSLD